ncbi:MFS transporter [Thalassococcus sp. S3]|uniref:MFS transporter n=1 Tax=Thalassococcus sp. S3 TaxID=2017482 RepID=UPI0010248040|nr:MFS transporter [Thalassococcus sp. S3]QBF31412.1 MFS transporter [Thalassococcus sp. S3]
MSLFSILTNRNFAGLFAANTILGAAFPIQLVLGGLAGLMLSPDPAFATLPSSVQTLAAMLAAAPFSLLMQRVGRTAGFALGGVLTALGGIAAIEALSSGTFALLCAAHFLMGAGWASFQYFRFAAGEVVGKQWRPVAISLMLSSLLIAAIVGPQVFIAAKDALYPIPFVGAYAAVSVIGVIGLVPLAFVRMPAVKAVTSATRRTRLGMLAALRRPAIKRAVGIAAVAQGIMVFLMIPTPIAMVSCGFGDAEASDVIRWHIVAMFAPSFFTGFLIKRFGAETIATVGLATIIASAIGAALGITAMHFYGALIVLGIGWNFAFIAATTMLDAAVTSEERAVVQGINDTLVALVSTVSAFSAGFAFAYFGWTVLALMSAGLVAVALVAPVLLRLRSAY